MIIEMRTYKTKPGMRSQFLAIFRSKSVPAHAEIGMKILGPFLSVEDPDTFFFMRGFPDLPSRGPMKAKFYEGELWKRELENVLLPMLEKYDVVVVEDADGVRPASLIRQQWRPSANFSTGWDRRRACLVRLHRFLPLSLQRSPSHVASKVLPEALQPPDHMQLPIRKVFQEAVAHQPGHILPIVISFVGQFFLQHRTDRNHRRKPIPEQHELKKECPAQGAKGSCQ